MNVLQQMILLFQLTAVGATRPSGQALIEQLEHYRHQPQVTWQVEKSVHSELLNKATVTTGQLVYARNVFNVQFGSEKVIDDGKSLWVINEGETGIPRQVTHAPVSKNSHILIEIFNARRDSKQKLFESLGSRRFKLVKKTASAINEVIVELAPKGQLLKISYKDDLENKTEIRFLSEKLETKKDSSLFRFKPKKGDQVSEL